MPPTGGTGAGLIAGVVGFGAAQDADRLCTRLFAALTDEASLGPACRTGTGAAHMVSATLRPTGGAEPPGKIIRRVSIMELAWNQSRRNSVREKPPDRRYRDAGFNCQFAIFSAILLPEWLWFDWFPRVHRHFYFDLLSNQQKGQRIAPIGAKT